MRILVVEDDAKMRSLLLQGLEENDFLVDVAEDGERGLSCAALLDYDAMVLDIMLPGMDGFAVCRELRARGKATPILMLTARSSVPERIRGLECGVDDYLTKPFDLQELIARLRSITRRSGQPPQDVLKVGDLELNPGSHRAWRAGRSLELTARQFTLLEYMMRRKGLVVTQSMILDHVWGLEYDGDTNLVPVYINRLRAKLDQGFDTKLIHTIRGAGYSLRKD
jgi:two-component system copper resistance phosphate regulon response regulator CusR